MGTITGEAIPRFQLIVQRSAIKLEKLGMKHSGGNVTPWLKKHFGLPRSATHDDVIARINQELGE